MVDHVAGLNAPASSLCVDCGAPPNARGLKRERCSRCYPKHWRTLKLSGSFVDLRIRPLKERLLEKTVAGYGGCVIYTGGLNPGGYGNIQHEGKSLSAHRVAYELLIGPVPEGMHLDHLCHTRDLSCHGGAACLHRRCINPHHMEPVPPAENTRRGRSPQSLKTHCPQGHPYDEGNTHISRSGGRICRTCRRERLRGYKAKARAAARARAAADPCGHVSRDGNACRRSAGHEGQHTSNVPTPSQADEALRRVRETGGAR